MIKDERIRETINRYAARGFFMWYFLLLIVLLYRQFYLKQPVSEFLDLGIIFAIGTMYVGISCFAQGVYSGSISKYLKTVIPVVSATNLAVLYYRGQLNSFHDFLGAVLGCVVGASVIGFIIYYLNRAWEKKSDLTD